MKNKLLLKLFCLGIVGLMLGGCRTLPPPEQQAKLRVKALIDGADTVHVQGDSVWIEHHAYELPGRWRGANEPIYINGEAWKPTWTENISSKYEGLGSDPLPAEAVNVSMTFYATTWGDVNIVQQPDADNDYTLVISIDDRGPEGAHWYTVDLDW